jgi:hypothetical protein
MRSTTARILPLLVWLLLPGPSSLSQDKGELEVQWHSLAWVGVNGPMQPLGMTAGVEAALQSGADLYIAHVFFSQELRGLGGGHGPDLPDERMTGLALMYGRAYTFSLSRPLFPLFPLPFLLSNKDTEYRATAAIGISLNRSTLRDGPMRYFTSDGVLQSTRDPVARTGIGLPIHVELTQMLTTSIGYAHRAVVNVNGARTLWMVNWAVQYTW